MSDTKEYIKGDKHVHEAGSVMIKFAQYNVPGQQGDWKQQEEKEAEELEKEFADFEEVDEANDADGNGGDLLVNNIFRDDIFTSNRTLVMLRQTIANAIGQGDTGKIDLTHAYEWFWLYAGLSNAGFLETRSNRENAVTDAGFVRQIALWFPDMLDVNDKRKIRQICNGLSTERNKWTMNGKQISLVDIEANKRRLTAMKETKVNRIVSVAYQGLYVPLTALKQKIERENNS